MAERLELVLRILCVKDQAQVVDAVNQALEKCGQAEVLVDPVEPNWAGWIWETPYASCW